jgi:hypothetical protein
MKEIVFRRMIGSTRLRIIKLTPASYPEMAQFDYEIDEICLDGKTSRPLRCGTTSFATATEAEKAGEALIRSMRRGD